MRVAAGLAGGAGGAPAQHAALEINASASGQAGVAACARSTSAAAASAPVRARSAAEGLMRPDCNSQRMRGDRQGHGRCLRRAMKGSGLNPNRSRARVTAARHTASAAASDDEREDAARGGQGLEVRHGAAEEGGTWALRRT